MAFATAVRLADLPVQVPVVIRPIGQMIVASSVGLSFTPAAVAAFPASQAALIAPIWRAVRGTD